MNAIAVGDEPLGAAAAPAPWRALLAEVRQQLHQLAAHPARSVVLLPYAQLLPLAARLWAAQFPDSFAPRFETTRSWAERAGLFVPGPHDLVFDPARDLLTAATLLEGAGLASQRTALAGPLLEQASLLGRLAASLPPTLRPDWAERARAALPAAASGPLALESRLAHIAIAWAAHSDYASDVLFAPRTTAALDALVIVPGLQTDALTTHLAEHLSEKAVLLAFDAPAPGAAVALHRCLDAEDEAERAAACVLRHLHAGRTPVALVATDRGLTRRINALLAARGVQAGAALHDETGWRLSTTHAGAALMAALRACAPAASTDAVLDWLKLAPAFDGGAVAALEHALRQRAVRGWAQAAQITQGQPLTTQIEALRAPLAAPRPLTRWLADVRALLQGCGLWPLLAQDAAGSALIEALALDDAHGSAWRDWPPAQRRMGLGEFTRWVSEALEAASYRAPQIGAPAVVVLPLAQLLARPFAAVVLPGADEQRLPAAPEPPGPWSDAQRAALHLPTRADLQREQAAAWVLALGAPQLDVLWRHGDDSGQSLLASPLVLALDFALNPGASAGVVDAPDPRTPRSGAAAPTERPRPSGAPLPTQPLSASRYQQLRECPYRFFALRQLGLQGDDELDLDVDKRDWGIWLHAVLAAFHTALAASPGADRVALIEQAAQQVTAQTLDGSFEPSEFMPFAAAWPALRDAYLNWLADHEADGFAFAAAEVERSGPCGTLQLRGRIDRIDRDAHGAPLLIDYKTERGEKTSARVKAGSEDTQLPFYALLSGLDAPRAAYLNLPERGEPKLHELPDLAERAAQLYEGIERDMTQIAAGAPLPALGEGSVCDWCEVRGLCRKDFWG